MQMDTKSNNSMEKKMKMHMTFYWGKEVTLLFEGWTTDSVTEFCIALAILFVLSVFHEYVVSRRAQIRSAFSALNPAKVASSCCGDDEGANFSLMFALSKESFVRRVWMLRAAETFLFGVNALLGYLLMLAAMSFNAGVVLSIVAGLCAGFFLFRSGSFVGAEDDDDLRLSADPCSSCT